MRANQLTIPPNLWMSPDFIFPNCKSLFVCLFSGSQNRTLPIVNVEVQRCPQCKYPFELSGGCPFVVCPFLTKLKYSYRWVPVHFCWMCGGNWHKQQQSPLHGHISPCSCKCFYAKTTQVCTSSLLVCDQCWIYSYTQVYLVRSLAIWRKFSKICWNEKNWSHLSTKCAVIVKL